MISIHSLDTHNQLKLQSYVKFSFFQPIHLPSCSKIEI